MLRVALGLGLARWGRRGAVCRLPAAGLLADYDPDKWKRVTLVSGAVSALAPERGAWPALVQNTAGDRPLYNAAGLAGYATVTFDGVSDYLKTALFAVSQAHPFTVYLVMRQISWTAADVFMDGNVNGSNGVRQFGTAPQILMRSGGVQGAPTAGPAIGTWAVLVAVFNGATSSLRINLGTAAAQAVAATNLDALTLGRLGGTAGSFAHWEMARAGFFSGAHDAATQDPIIGRLARQYRIAV
jgi:hypothetical protein